MAVRNELRIRRFHFRITKEVRSFVQYGGTQEEAVEGLLLAVQDCNVPVREVTEIARRVVQEAR